MNLPITAISFQLQNILGGEVRFYELFSGRKVMEGAGREARDKEPPFPWAPHLTCKCCYSTHATERSMDLYISKTQAAS